MKNEDLSKEQLIARVKSLESELSVLVDNEVKKQEAQDRYKSLTNATFEAVFISEEGICLEVNKIACDLFGYDHDEFVGKHSHTLFSEEYEELVKTNVTLGYEEPYIAVAKRKDGSSFHCEIRGKMTNFQKKRIRISALRNIDEQVRTNKALLESKTRYKTLYQSSRDAIMMLTPDEGFIAGNQATIELFQCKDEKEFISQKPDSLSPEKQPDGSFSSHKSQQMMANAMANGSHFFEWVHKRKNGSEFYATVLLTKMKLLHKTVLQATVRDITTDKKSREELQSHRNHLEELVKKRTSELERINIQFKEAKDKAEESDKLKSAFLSNMSHEIRTPMNSIIGFSELLRDKTLSNKQINSYIDIIIRQGNLLLNIINDIIDISKIQADKLIITKSACDVDGILDDLYITYLKSRELNDKPDVKLRIVKPKETNHIFINSDPYRLKQVMSNLITNAIKFTYSGYVEMGYRIIKGADISKIRFYVKDTGIGIDPDQQHVIFERFRQIDGSHTRKFGGTGLGLNISKRIVEMLEGDMDFTSEFGHGSLFYFNIPMDEVQVGEKFPEMKNELDVEYDWSSKTILIVEDDKDSFVLLKHSLSKSKAKIIHADNGKKAVEICTTNSKINLVIMDIQLPYLNGLDAMKLIKSYKNELPIIAQTAYALAGEKEKSIEAGFDDYISKPIHIDSLLKILDKYLQPL